MTKIAFIGAGSVVFAKTLICDILQYPAFSQATLCLMDIDPERLEVTRVLTERVILQLGLRATVTATTDLREACKDAKYVITMIQVGGYEPATVADFEIPKKFGLRQTIGDTLGVGGIFRALRTIPELIKVAEAMQAVGADEPILINYSNPMAMNMMGIERRTGIPSVGLCHSVQGTSRNLAAYAEVPYEDVSYLVAGINHVAFFLKFEYKGRDAYPLLFRALDNPDVVSRDRVRFEMMRRLGYFVTESSEHFSEYCSYFIPHGERTIKEFDIPLDEYPRRCRSIISTWEKTQSDLLDPTKPIPIWQSIEYGSQIIHAMETDSIAKIYGNVPNRGVITNLPASACVEVPCLVDRQGVQPVLIGQLPSQLSALIQTNINVQELAVEAALTGSREAIYHALMLDPNTSGQLKLDQIWAMADELIEAHQKEGFLGEFSKVRAHTGRSEKSLARVLVSFAETFDSSSDAGIILLEAEVQNDLDCVFADELALDIDGTRFEFLGTDSLSVHLAAGEASKFSFSIRRLDGAADTAFRVGIKDPPACVLAVDYAISPRARFKADGSPIPVEVRFAEEAMASGTLTVDGSALRLSVRVADTAIRVVPDVLWSSSVIGLYFADPKRLSRKPTVLSLLPEPEHPRAITHDGTVADTIQVGLEVDPRGYNLNATVPYEAFGMTKDRDFLLEIAFRINAFGDAHGYTTRAWQDSANPAASVSNYAWIEGQRPASGSA